MCLTVEWKNKRRCITYHPDFGVVCLQRVVLRTALVAMHDVSRGDLQDPLTNRLEILKFYLWYCLHGFLTAEIQVHIESTTNAIK